MTAQALLRMRLVTMAGCALVWIAAEWQRARGPFSSGGAPQPSIQSSPGAIPASSASGPHPVATGTRIVPGRHDSPRVLAATRSLVSDVLDSHDAAGGAVLTVITNTLPPGWDRGFVLHDCLLAVVTLTDLARLESPTAMGVGDVSPTGAHPMETLEEPQKAFHGFIAELLVRWLSRKHPALGEETIRTLLREHTLGMNPTLGPYDLIPVDESMRLLGIPDSPPSAPGPTVMELPPSVDGRYRPGARPPE